MSTITIAMKLGGKEFELNATELGRPDGQEFILHTKNFDVPVARLFKH